MILLEGDKAAADSQVFPAAVLSVSSLVRIGEGESFSGVRGRQAPPTARWSGGLIWDRSTAAMAIVAMPMAGRSSARADRIGPTVAIGSGHSQPGAPCRAAHPGFAFELRASLTRFFAPRGIRC